MEGTTHRVSRRVIMKLGYQQPACALTLREGVAEYRAYLESIGRKVMTDLVDTRMILEHDVTHVIFGMDTSLEQEAGLDTWVIFGCQFHWSYLRRYSQLPQIKALYRALIAEGGWWLFLRLYWKCLGLKWRVFLRTRRMIKKWPFQFPEEWLDLPISSLRNTHGIDILGPDERDTGQLIWWSGVY